MLSRLSRLWFPEVWEHFYFFPFFILILLFQPLEESPGRKKQHIRPIEVSSI